MQGASLPPRPGALSERRVPRPSGFTLTVWPPLSHVLSPLSDRSAPSPVVASPSAPPSEDLDPAERPVILLVGEDDGLRHELRSRVEWSYRVEEATSGPAALARALDDAPDLVLLDVTLPDIDAVALLAALRDDDRTYDVPVVLLSAGAGCGPTDDVLGLAAGVAGLVTDWEPLLRAPASALGPALDSTDQALLETVDATIRAPMAAPGVGARALAEAVGRSPRHLRRLIA